MTILDVNILLFVANVDAPEHMSAQKWLRGLFAGSDSIGLAWVTIWAFLRISTHPRAFLRPLAAEDAFITLREWLMIPNVKIVEPGPRHLEFLEMVVRENGAIGSLVTDAALAALALEHEAVIASTDRDFGRFREIRWVNPLEQRVN